jgi:hypothetical protein
MFCFFFIINCSLAVSGILMTNYVKIQGSMSIAKATLNESKFNSKATSLAQEFMDSKIYDKNIALISPDELIYLDKLSYQMILELVTTKSSETERSEFILELDNGVDSLEYVKRELISLDNLINSSIISTIGVLIFTLIASMIIGNKNYTVTTLFSDIIQQHYITLIPILYISKSTATLVLDVTYEQMAIPQHTYNVTISIILLLSFLVLAQILSIQKEKVKQLACAN